MAEQDSGSKTELPTPKRLREARKKGDVAKVPDVSITIGFLFALLLLYVIFGGLVASFMSLTEQALASPGKAFGSMVQALGSEAIEVFVATSAAVLIPLALFCMIVEFLVTGPVVTAEKFKPKLSNLDPVQGFKRMFGADNLVELIKSVIKTAILCIIGYLTVRSVLGDLALLPWREPERVVSGMWYLSIRVFGWASLAYILMMFVDIGYQRYSFTKRMKMSIRDIRDELKETEGDPMLRNARRTLGDEWAREAPDVAARDASVLVVNPVHVAVAVRYDRELAPLPVITGRGEEATARSMRAAAAAAGVPVLRNEQLARTLLASETENDYVPRELFEIVAEVLLWARSARTRLERGTLARQEDDAGTLAAPGEDLTAYHPEFADRAR